MILKHWKPERVKRLVQDMRKEVSLTTWVNLPYPQQRALVAERVLIGILAQAETPSKEACWELVRAMNHEARQQLPWSSQPPPSFWVRCWNKLSPKKEIPL